MKKILLAFALAITCTLSSHGTLHAQESGDLLVAVPLLHGNSQQTSPSDVLVYRYVQGFIRILNSFEQKPFIYANPQMGTPNQMAVWLLNNDVDVAMLTYPIYAAIEAVGLANEVVPIATVTATDSVIVGNPAACQSSLPLEKNIPNGLFITRNEYSSNGRLLALVLFARMGANPKIFYNGETLNNALDHFLAQETSQMPTYFLINTIDQQQALAMKGSCILQKDIAAPWPATIVVMRKDLPLEKQRMMKESVLKLSTERAKFLPVVTGNASFIVEQVSNFVPIDGTFNDQLKEARALIQQYHLDLRSFFTISQLMLRMEDWVKEGPVAIILTAADSRAPYSLGVISEILGAVNERKEVADHVFLTGTSGGALSSVIMSLSPTFRTLSPEVVHNIVDPNALLAPSIRFKALTFWIDWWPLLLFIIIFMPAIFFHSPIVLWKDEVDTKRLFSFFIVALVLLIVSVAFAPDIPLEYGTGMVLGGLVLMIALRATARHLEIGPRTYALAVFIMIVSLVTVRTMINRPALLDDLDFDPSLRELVKVDPSLRNCATIRESGKFSACLFSHIKYPLVITTADISRGDSIFFYAEPAGKHIFEPPRSGRWINLATCPENFLRAAAGSAVVPFVFPPKRILCNGEEYQMMDGTIYSSGTTNVAKSLGAATALNVLNEPFTAQDILKKSVIKIEKSNVLYFLGGLMKNIFGYNYYHEFQLNLLDIRQVMYTPPSNEFILPNYRYFGMKKDGINYTPDKIYQMGREHALRNEKGLFIQISGGRFEFDSFKKQLEKQVQK
jgi:hypothetical protein